MKITFGNILAVFFMANEAELLEGRNWYPRANTIAKSIAEKYNIEFNTVAGVIAALSPNNRWSRNIQDAENLIRAHASGEVMDAVKVSTFGNNKHKAIAILQGNNPDLVLGGNKVRAFYGCIICRNDVCVDGHAYSIWLGERVPTSQTPSISDKLYDVIAGDYRKATEVINGILGERLLPSEVQAVTWVVWRNRIKGNANE